MREKPFCFSTGAAKAVQQHRTPRRKREPHVKFAATFLECGGVPPLLPNGDFGGKKIAPAINHRSEC